MTTRVNKTTYRMVCQTRDVAKHTARGNIDWLTGSDVRTSSNFSCDLSTVGTCDIFVNTCVTESCDSPDWTIQYYLSSPSSRVTETVSMKMPCGECFQKCFSAYNMISLWLNTVIPIIVMIWLPKKTRYLHWRIVCTL